MLFQKPLILSVLSSIFWLFLPASVMAETPANPPANAPAAMPKLNEEQKAMMLEVQKLQQSLQQTQQALQKVQQKVYQDNPELRQQRDALQKNIASAMSDGDYNAETELAALNQLVEKYQNAKEQPSQQQIEAFQKKQQRFQQKQRDAFQDPAIQKQAESLQQSVRTAIEASGESGKSLLVRLESQIQKLTALRQKAMKMMQSQ